jgi:hypothetical protein
MEQPAQRVGPQGERPATVAVEGLPGPARQPSGAVEEPVGPVLWTIETLLDKLNHRGVRYCHWKSNHRLDVSLSGGDDLDLLVERRDVPVFQEVLAACGFRRTSDSVKATHSSLEQFFALDPATMRLFHIDAYYRIITGETLIKEYHLPLEAMLLCSRQLRGKIPLPSPAADLTTLVIRLMIKLSSPAAFLQWGQAGLRVAARQEIARLWGPGRREEVHALLAEHLPSVDPREWDRCLEGLSGDRSTFRLRLLARTLKAQIAAYRRLSPPVVLVRQLAIAARTVYYRSVGHGRTKNLMTGGAVVAFVGPEATGKSTLSQGMVDWLGGTFETKAVHLGKPPATWLSIVPNMALPLLRRMAGGHRTDTVPSGSDGMGRKVSPLFAARCLMLAWDRFSAAKRAHRRAANGCLVFCDRYPSAQLGSMDSARLPLEGAAGWRARAATLEQRLYRRIPQPDLVLQLSAPPGIAVERNRNRTKPGKETDERILTRHVDGQVPMFRARTVLVDTEGELAATLRTAKAVVWREL